MDQQQVCQGVKDDLGQQDRSHERQAGQAKLPDQCGGEKAEDSAQPAGVCRQQQAAFGEISQERRKQPGQQPVFQEKQGEHAPGEFPGIQQHQAVFRLVSQPEDRVRAAQVCKQNAEEKQA